MLKTYEVILENDQIRWLKEQPHVKSARAIITLLEDDVPTHEGAKHLLDSDLRLEELGGSEPQAKDIPRRRYDS